ncbi:hypothetical protein BSKO_03486 [Bryopsis sp. KO-2023]|nr:hypothetical protein BSKO_03486 [Bryopsis sp. KO-2023]
MWVASPPREHRQPMFRWLLICALLSAQAFIAAGVGEFRVGVVINPSSEDSLLADRGYDIFAEAFDRNFTDGFQLGGFKFRFKVARREVASNASTRLTAWRDLFGSTEQAAHFALGYDEEFAFDEARMSTIQERIFLHCCATNPKLFESNQQFFFGMQSGTEATARQVVELLPGLGIRNVSMVYRSDLPEEVQMCEDIRKDLQTFQHLNIVHQEKLTAAPDKNALEPIIGQIQNARAEVFIGCMTKQDAVRFTKAYSDPSKHPLGAGAFKALFFTQGPGDPDYVKELKEMSHFSMSVLPWHHTAQFSDRGTYQLFGGMKEYKALSRKLFRDPTPHWRTGLTSGAMYTLLRSIQDAFLGCDISNTGGDVDQLLFNASAIICEGGQGESGYDRVRFTMQYIFLEETIAGPVYFDKWRKNKLNPKVTVQVLNASGDFQSTSILPLSIADQSSPDLLMRLPASNPFLPEECPLGREPGSDPFDPCPLCTPGHFSDYPGDCQLCGIGKYTPLFGQQKCEPCPLHSVTLVRGAVSLEECVCKEGFYRPDQKSGLECFECPEGGICDGRMSLPYPMKGFWADHDFREEMYECDPEIACKGATSENFEELCSKGYENRGCSVCAYGFFRLAGECHACTGKVDTVLLLIGVFVVWYSINKVVSDQVETVNGILNWAQLLNVIASLQLKWPTATTKFFNVVSFLDFDVDIVEPSCLGPWSFTHNYIVQLLLPVGLTLFAAGNRFIGIMLHKMSSEKSRNFFVRILCRIYRVPRNDADRKMMMNSLVSVSLAAMEITYITITRYNFDVLRCDEIAGKRVMSASVDIECNSSKYKVLWGIAVFSMVAYTVGYLALVAYKLIEMHWKGTFAITTNLERYGFLYARFELEFFWTPLLDLAIKIAFVGISVYVDDAMVAAALLAVVVVINLLVLVYTRPFLASELDLLQVILSTVLLAVTFGGIIVSNPKFPRSKVAVVEGVVLTMVSSMWAVFLVLFLMEWIRKTCVWVLKKKHARALDTTQRDISDTLYDTFDAQFLYRWLRTADKTTFQDFEKLNGMLADYVVDASFMSYLSQEMVAVFWRRLVDNFPELIDFLATADDEAREHFTKFSEVLYKDFFLAKSLRGGIHQHLVWKDQAAVAHWIALASKQDRDFFVNVIGAGWKTVYGEMHTREILEGKISESRLGAEMTSPLWNVSLSSSSTSIRRFHTIRVQREIRGNLGPIRRVSSTAPSSLGELLEEGEEEQGKITTPDQPQP